MEQVLICLKKQNGLYLDVLDARQKELVALGTALRECNSRSIATHVKKAFDAGASREEILKVVEFVVGDFRLLKILMGLLKTLRYEENNRQEYISVVEDCRED